MLLGIISRLILETFDSLNLRTSSFDTIDGTSVDYLTVTTGAAGNVVVQAQVLPIKQEEVIAERKSIRSYGEY